MVDNIRWTGGDPNHILDHFLNLYIYHILLLEFI